MKKSCEAEVDKKICYHGVAIDDSLESSLVKLNLRLEHSVIERILRFEGREVD